MRQSVVMVPQGCFSPFGAHISGMGKSEGLVIAVGIAIGVPMGLLLDNIVAGIAIGLAMAIAAGLVLKR